MNNKYKYEVSEQIKLKFVLDNLIFHRSKTVKDFLQENKEKIEVFYLQAYSQELNPD